MRYLRLRVLELECLLIMVLDLCCHSWEGLGWVILAAAGSAYGNNPVIAERPGSGGIERVLPETHEQENPEGGYGTVLASLHLGLV